MALSTADLKYLRTKVGSREPPTDADLQDGYDRLGILDAVAREILEIRLADLLADPASFSVSGEYSQDTSANIRELRETLGSLGGQSALGTGTVQVAEPESADAR